MKKRVLLFISIAAVAVLMAIFVAKPATVSASGVKVIALKYEIISGGAVPGEDFVLRLYLKNESDSLPAESAHIQFYGETSIIAADGYTNQEYIGTIEPLETVTVDFHMHVSSKVLSPEIQLQYGLYYTAFDENNIVMNSYTAIPIEYVSQVEVAALSIADVCNVGGNALVSITYFNTAKDAINDIKLILSGLDGNSSQTIELGKLPPQASDSKDTYISFSTSGTKNVGIKIEYIDGAGEAITKDLGIYSIRVNEKISGADGNDDYPTVEIAGKKNLEYYFLIGGVCLIVLCAVISLLKMISKRQ